MIPGFQTIMLPYLQLLGDGKEYSNSHAEEALSKTFNLSDAERKQMLPSARGLLFYNRIAWALFHLKKALLIERVSRGAYKITQRGLDVLKEKPQRVDLPYLMRYPEFQEFRAKKSTDNGGKKEVIEEQEEHSTETPEEILDGTYQSLQNILAKELLEKIQKSSPLFFEQVVIDLLLAMGYGGSRAEAASLTKQSGDEGIDGIIKEDRLGLDAIYVQAKRWQDAVGRQVVQSFVGSLEGKRANKGVIITTSYFSKGAEEYVKQIGKKIVLIDGEKLADLMIEHNVGIIKAQTYEIKKVDADYFGEE